MHKNPLYIVCLLLLCACTSKTPERIETFTRLTDCPAAVAAARAFAVADKAYVYGGRDVEGKVLSTLHIYDPATDTWTLTSTPMRGRVNAAVAVWEQKAYVGLGYNGTLHDTTSYLQDWWVFEPQANTWTQLAPMPVKDTDAPVVWALGGAIYVAHGFHDRYSRDVWRYDIAKNEWTQLNDGLALMDYPDRTFGSVGAVCQGRCFAGTGHFKQSQSQWSEYLTETHEWIRLKPVPGSGRVCATATANDNHVYVIGGWHFGGSLTNGFLYDDVLCYDPQTDTWTLSGQMPDGKNENRISFTLNNHVYFGLGENADGPNNHLYRID